MNEFEFKIGDVIRIVNMSGEEHYTGRVGVVEFIDDMGQLHGTWGELGIIPEFDLVELVESAL